MTNGSTTRLRRLFRFAGQPWPRKMVFVEATWCMAVARASVLLRRCGGRRAPKGSSPSSSKELGSPAARVAPSRATLDWAGLRQTLRAHRQSANPLVRWGITTLIRARRLCVLCANAEHRSVVRARLFSPGALHQTTPITWMDRYPGIFSACRAHLGDREDLRLLSFGCSTGEEVLTLRRYFPCARIVGAEINRRSLAACRSRRVDERICFLYSDPPLVRSRGPYDAIFCLAVLQRTPEYVANAGILSLKGLYPFEKFDRQIHELDKWLKVGGLLIVHFSQYRMADTSVASRYAALEPEGYEVDRSPKFDRDSRRLQWGVPSGSIFVKRASA